MQPQIVGIAHSTHQTTQHTPQFPLTGQLEQPFISCVSWCSDGNKQAIGVTPDLDRPNSTMVYNSRAQSWNKLLREAAKAAKAPPASAPETPALTTSCNVGHQSGGGGEGEGGEGEGGGARLPSCHSRHTARGYRLGPRLQGCTENRPGGQDFRVAAPHLAPQPQALYVRVGAEHARLHRPEPLRLVAHAVAVEHQQRGRGAGESVGRNGETTEAGLIPLHS
jgi:hypothetical protein